MKNPLHVLVMSADSDMVPFTLIRHDGFLTSVDHAQHPSPMRDPRPRSIDTLRTTTPLELVGTGGSFLFLAGGPKRLRIEAWRQFGKTKHVAAEGLRLILRAEGLDEMPEISTGTAFTAIQQ